MGEHSSTSICKRVRIWIKKSSIFRVRLDRALSNLIHWICPCSLQGLDSGAFKVPFQLKPFCNSMIVQYWFHSRINLSRSVIAISEGEKFNYGSKGSVFEVITNHDEHVSLKMNLWCPGSAFKNTVYNTIMHSSN